MQPLSRTNRLIAELERRRDAIDAIECGSVTLDWNGYRDEGHVGVKEVTRMATKERRMEAAG